MRGARQPSPTLRLGGALAVAVVVASCAGESKEKRSGDPTSPSPAGAAMNGRLTARPGRQDGDDRRGTGLRPIGSGGALLYVPADRAAKRLVVVLHGAGGSPREALTPLLPLAEEAGLLLLAPQSKGRTWDVALGGFGPDVSALDRLLRNVFAHRDVDSSGVAVAGFSDGASYALSLGLTNGDLFGAVLAFSPGFIAFAEAHGSPRLFISHGTHDRVLPIGQTSRRGVPRLRAAGYRVRYREFPGGHELPPQIAREAVEWLVSEAA